jgi:glutaredoxin-related protein
MRKIMYKSLINNVETWQAQDNEDSSKIIFAKGARSCEIGETVYQSKKSHLRYSAIIIRALKPDAVNKLNLTEEGYDYQGWISSIDDSMPAAEVIKFYRKRGHSENFIRELKNGLDLHHYPCQKLNANKAYGLIAAFAYNLMRYVAVKDNPEKPRFSKAIRFKYISIPCHVVRHARSLVFRFMGLHFKGVSKWLMEMGKTIFSLPSEGCILSG